jgi:DNA polymerase I
LNIFEEYYRQNVTSHTGNSALRRLRDFIKNPDKYGNLVLHDTETNGLDSFAGRPVMHYPDGRTIKTRGAQVFCHVLGLYNVKRDKLYMLYGYVENRPFNTLVSQILADEKITKIGHNYKFDIQVCYNTGMTIKGDIYDTLTASRMTHAGLMSHSLKDVGNHLRGLIEKEDQDRWEQPVKKWLAKAGGANTRKVNTFRKKNNLPPLTGEDKDDLKNYINYSAVPEELMIPYALQDIWNTFVVWQATRLKIEEHYADLFKVEIALLKILVQVERQGIRIDRTTCDMGMERLGVREEQLDEKIKKRVFDQFGLEDFKQNSPKEMIKLLRMAGVTEKHLTNNKGKISSDKDVLKRVQREYPELDFMDLVVLYKYCIKIKNTYFKAFKYQARRDCAVHGNIKSSDTKTGRAAMANPNLQNIPNPKRLAKESKWILDFLRNVPPVRSAFVPNPNYQFGIFDYSQIEMRIFAIYTQEEGMMQAIRDGVDLHDGTAKMMFPKYAENPELYRTLAKAINFGIVFGMGIEKLANELLIPRSEAQELRTEYFRQFPGVKTLQNKCKHHLWREGYLIGLFGRRFEVPESQSYAGVNRIVQGTAANVLKIATLQVHRLFNELGLDKNQIRMLLTIHDELVFEMRKSLPMWIYPAIKMTMEEIKPVLQYGIKTDVDIEIATNNWAEKSNWEITDKAINNAKLPTVQDKMRRMRDLRLEATEQAKIILSEKVDFETLTCYNVPEVDWFLN